LKVEARVADNRFGNQNDRLYAAVVTPFKDNYDVDEGALRKLLNYFKQPRFVDAEEL
jgi:hypothetical protein